ncbi:MAG TPA: hypothetical protein VK807_24375 [Gemmatimonadaceae bacterium]|nr:hypothetical protein [Gemmatimonadaceae bacterium]
MLDRNRDRGGGAIMVTLTLPHDAGDALRPMAAHVARAMQYVQTGREWVRVKGQIGFRASVRALEVTYGTSGWHPHVHMVICTDRALSDAEREDVRVYFYRRWVYAITRPNKDTGRVYRTPSVEHGVTVTESHRDDYLAKLGLADEVVRGSVKQGHEGSRTPFQILDDIAVADRALGRKEPFDAEARERDIALYQEYARGMHGRRQLTYSRDARALFGLDDEVDDEQLMLDIEAGDAPDRVTEVEPDVWSTIVETETRAAALRAAEQGGADGYLRMSDRLMRGLPPDPPP